MFGKFFASVTNRILVGVSIALVILVVTLALTVKSVNRKNADLRTENGALTAQLDAANRNFAAHEKAAGERVADTVAIAKAQKELNDAIEAVPDTVPDAVAVAVGCRELRGAGYLDADLPAACRLGSGSQASAQP